MQNHVKIVGWTYIGLGVLGVLIAALVFLLVAGGGVISGDETAARITGIVAVVIAAVITLFSLPGILAGAGLLRLRSWGRYMAVILGLLNLPGFPVGTLLGIYTIWVMLDNETGQIFAG